MRILLFVVLLCLVGTLHAQDPKTKTPFDAIDRHALDAPAEAEASVAALAKYLATPARRDHEKARSIFRWLADRVAYDFEALRTNQLPKDVSAAGVLKNRLTVCDGYANLFVALAREAGLDAVKIHGYARGFGYKPGEKIDTNHAWNAVKIDGAWMLLDATWGAGYLDAQKGFIKRLEDFYFLPAADALIFSHFPNDAKWQFLDPVVTKETFQPWPKVSIGLLKLGIEPKEIRTLLEDKSFPGLVNAFDYPGTAIRVVKAPLQGKLEAGTKLHVRVEAACSDMAFVMPGSKFVFLPRKNGAFEGTVVVPKGALRVSAKIPGKGAAYWPILDYVGE
jgi:hypothetical protein